MIPYMAAPWILWEVELTPNRQTFGIQDWPWSTDGIPLVMISISCFVFCSPSTLNTVTFKAAKGGSLQQPGYTLRLISMTTAQNNWEMVGHWSWYVSFSHPFSLWLVSCRPFWLLLAPRSIGAFICFLNRKTPPHGHDMRSFSGSKPESQPWLATFCSLNFQTSIPGSFPDHFPWTFPDRVSRRWFSQKREGIPWNPMEFHGIPASPGLHVGFWLHAMDWWCRVRRMGISTGEWSLNGWFRRDT